MTKQDEKRARIIAAQLVREQTDREAGRVPDMPAPRRNWAATHPAKPKGLRRPKPPHPRP